MVKHPLNSDPGYVNDGTKGIVYDDTTGCNGMRFELQMKASLQDGNISADTSGLAYKKCLRSIASFFLKQLLLTALINVLIKKANMNIKSLLLSLSKASSKTYTQLLNEHLADYHQFYNRVLLRINDSTSPFIFFTNR